MKIKNYKDALIEYKGDKLDEYRKAYNDMIGSKLAQCSRCGHDDFYFADKSNRKGIYCSYCGKWLKWADKDEQNLAAKQEAILDKIRVEIVDTGAYEQEVNGKTEFLKGINYCLSVIDGYMAESEDIK